MNILQDLNLADIGMVIFVDIVLSGDNAIVIGMAAATLPAFYRKKAIIWGIGIAVVLRIILSALTFYLLKITGIKLIGALLLLGVCYSMWKELISGDAHNEELLEAESDLIDSADNATGHLLLHSGFRRAMLTIIVADISMSLDNVLAVAGVAGDDISVLIFGLALSIVLMGIGATLIAKCLDKHRWLGYVGLAIICYVAIEMGWSGIVEIADAI